MAAAASFGLLASDAHDLRRPLAEAARQVPRPAFGLVFVAGALSQDHPALARLLRACWPGVPTLVVRGAGVLSERGEHEGQAAVSGILASGPRATPVWASESDESVDGALLERLKGQGAPATLLLFLAQTAGVTSLPARLTQACPGLRVLGGGSASADPMMLLDAQGQEHVGPAVGLVLHGPAPLVTLAPGCRLLGRARTVTEARGSALLRLDDEPALDALTQAAQGLEGKPLVMTMLLDREAGDELTGEVIRRSQLRPVRGVDPGRRAIMLGSPLREGDRIAFAALDSTAARQHLDHALRDLHRRTAGSAARFGLYLNCAGRGIGLHGTPDVDTRLLRSRFAGLPIAGLMSSFEIAPLPTDASLHFYTGIFALFTAPS